MPMKNPPHPGDLIRTEVIEALGLSVSKAADILKVRRATLSDLLHGKSALTPEMALRIEKAFGPDMDHLLRAARLRRGENPRARAGHLDQAVCPGLKAGPKNLGLRPVGKLKAYPTTGARFFMG